MNDKELSRTSNSIRNAFFGVIHIIVETIMPFILRTILLKVFDEQYLGLNNLFHSLLTVLSLTEAGFGTAIAYTLYMPMANKNEEEICGLLNLCKKIYIFIGLTVMILGLILIPFLSFLIKGPYPTDINLTIVYLIYLAETSSNYLFFSEKVALLGAAQRTDIRHKIFIIVELISYALRFVAILYFKSYYLYIAIIPITAIVIRIIINAISNRLYPKYICKGMPSNEQKHKIFNLTKDIAIQNFSTVISSSLGSIVVSATFGLSSTAVYGNYNYIATSLLSLSYIFVVSTTASIGNSVASKSVNENYDIFKKICFTNYWITCCFATCLMCLYQDFMKLWVGESLTSTIYLAISFTIYFCVFELRKPVLSFKDACGIWRFDRYKPIVSGLLNCVLCAFLTKYLNLLGPIISIIISTICVEIPWETVALFKGYFKEESLKDYSLSIVKYLFITIISIFICSFIINISVNDYLSFIIKGLLIFIVSNIVFIIFNYKNKLLKPTIKQVLSNIKF